MSYVLGEDRGQAALLPAAIEDYVAADAPVRVKAYVSLRKLSVMRWITKIGFRRMHRQKF